jgi:hypothetical protein
MEDRPFKEASTRRDAEPGSRKTMMLLLVVARELTKHAKGRILLDLHTVSTRSPHGGNDAYGNLKIIERE